MFKQAPKLNLAALHPMELLSRALARSPIQEPYQGAKRPGWLRVLPWLLFPPFGVFCFLYGGFFALTAPYLIVQMAMPLGILALLVIWALPDTRTAPTKPLEFLFFAYLVGLVLWPNYLGFSFPGLPWITVMRLTGFPAVFLLILCVSVSKEFRRQVGDALRATPLIWKMVVGFAAIILITVVMSKQAAATLNLVIAAEINWTAMFFIAVFVFLKPGRAARWAAMIWGMSLIIAGIGLWENRIHMVPWAGHIPSFLTIEDPIVVRILAGTQRAAVGVHRVQATWSTSLGLAEYLALTIPFVLHFAFGPYKFLIRVAAGLSAPLLLFIVNVTDSRLGMVGFLLGSLIYLMFWAILRWRQVKGSIFGPAITLAYPAIFVLALLSTFFVRRIRYAVWGSGAETASTQGRVSQYQDAFPLIFKNPIGYGMGQGGPVLNHRNPAGFLTIDTYYMSIALDNGVVGFICYYGALITAICYGVKFTIANDTKDRDLALLTPLTVALINFLVIKSVFSQQDNQPIYFMMMGMMVALVYRAQKAAADKRAAEALGTTKASRDLRGL